MNILITGAAGFIGFKLSLQLLKLNHNIFGIDKMDVQNAVEIIIKVLNLLKEKH